MTNMELLEIAHEALYYLSEAMKALKDVGLVDEAFGLLDAFDAAAKEAARLGDAADAEARAMCDELRRAYEEAVL